MRQRFRHVLRGVDAADVGPYVAEHRKRWWQGRHLSIRVRGDRLRAAMPASRFSQPPVLRATVLPGPTGAVLEGRLHRGVSAGLNLVILAATLLVVSIAAAAAGDDTSPTWLRVGSLLFAVLFVPLYPLLVLVGRLRRDQEATELAGSLDEFFGLRAPR